MRMLRKKGTTEPTFLFHPMLALRSDFEEFDDGNPDTRKNRMAWDVPGDVVVHEVQVSANPDPYSIMDKDQLRALLADRGVKIAGTPTLMTLQKRLAGLLEEGQSDAGD